MPGCLASERMRCTLVAADPHSHNHSTMISTSQENSACHERQEEQPYTCHQTTYRAKYLTPFSVHGGQRAGVFFAVACTQNVPVRLRTGWPLVSSLVGRRVDRQRLTKGARRCRVRRQVWRRSVQQTRIACQPESNHGVQTSPKPE